MPNTNFFYSLPDCLQNEIYTFDLTFANTFRNDDFKFDLQINHMFKFDKEKFTNVVLNQLFAYFDTLNFEGYTEWSNEFGFFCFNSDNEYSEQTDFVNFIEENYELSFFQDEDIIKFKILPLGTYDKKTSFLEDSSQERTFDGFICSIKKHELIEKGDLENPVPGSSLAVNDSDLTAFDIVVWIK